MSEDQFISVEKRTLHQIGNSLGVTLPSLFIDKNELDKKSKVYFVSLLNGHITVLSDLLDWDFINAELVKLQEEIDYKIDTGEFDKKAKKDKGIF